MKRTQMHASAYMSPLSWAGERYGGHREWPYPYLLHCASQPRSASTSATDSHTGNGASRAYPQDPRVGVGVVVFRLPPTQGQDPEVRRVQYT